MRRLAIHNCVCHSYFRDVELLTRGDVLLQTLGNRTPGGLLIVKGKEHLPSFGVLDEIKFRRLVVLEEFNNVAAAQNINVSHGFVCTLKD